MSLKAKKKRRKILRTEKERESVSINPMARRVSDNDAREDAYVACMLGAFQRKRL
jgi:hypothetical protein